MTAWQYLRLTWSSGPTLMSAPWGDLYLVGSPSGTDDWGMLAAQLGAAGWELVSSAADRREQVVSGDAVSGVLTCWTETYKRPEGPDGRAEYERAALLHLDRIEREEKEEEERAAAVKREAAETAAALEAEAKVLRNRQSRKGGTKQRYYWADGSLACVEHRKPGCKSCGPPEGHRQVGDTWVS